jgi:lipopolysaccharide export system protein LptA
VRKQFHVYNELQFSCLNMRLRLLPTLALGFTLSLLAVPVAAEKADRGKPLVIDADRPSTVDTQRQVVVFNGNVVISQGTLSLRAERVEVREIKDRERVVTAIGATGRQATYRQKRDAPNEWVEGSADRIEYDTRSDVLTFSGNASMRRLRGSEVADEITGGSITWDNTAGLFRVAGGAATAANPGGRVRAVLAPRIETPASAPAPAEGTTLTPSRSLGDKR